MGIVTQRTLPGFQGGVDAGTVHADLFLAVALVAELITGLLQQQFGNHPMAEMTFLTLVVLEYRVDIFQSLVFFSGCAMTVEAFLFGELPGSSGRLHRSKKGNNREYRHERCF